MKKVTIFSSLFTATALGVGAGFALATMESHTGSSNDHALHGTAFKPREAGQDAFAAVAEIVSILSNDPNTDWEKVDVNGLREHLKDMNALFMEAEVTWHAIENELVFHITGEGQTLRAIQAMVPAHAKELNVMPDWSADASNTEEGATLTVRSNDANVLAKIKGLGFFGLMATGTHHQPHHLQMAMGNRHTH